MKLKNTMTQRHPTTDGRPQRQGFSLVEILIVIAIIAILVGISVPAFMNRQGPQSTTRITLDALKGAATEYEVETGQPAVSLNSGMYALPVATNYSGTQYIDPSRTPPPAKAIIGVGEPDALKNFQAYSISRFVHQLLLLPTTNKMIRSLGNQVFLDSDGDSFADVVDGWDNKIVYFNPNDTYAPKIRQIFPPSRTPYFASAGEDGQWGDYSQLVIYRAAADPAATMTAANLKLAEQAKDNLYSFDQGK